MIKIVIPQNARDELIESKTFLLAIQLSRIWNIVRSNQRHYLRIGETNNPAATRDQLELILFHGAIVYEAIRTVLKHSNDLKKLKSWKQHGEAIKAIQIEYNGKETFCSTCLKPLRNEVIFHFDLLVMNIATTSYEWKKDTVFAEAKSSETGDLAFVLVP